MGRTRQHDEPPYPDRLLTPEAAAERFGVTKRWLLDHTDQIPRGQASFPQDRALQ